MRAALALTLLSRPAVARTGFVLITDEAALRANDTALWPKGFPGSSGGPLTSQVFGGTVNWGAMVHSEPLETDSLVQAVRRQLFSGTVARPGTCFYDLTLSLDVHGLSVSGIGTFVQILTGGTLVTATDVLGNSQTFDLGPNPIFPPPGPAPVFPFLGVLSDAPLARLEFFNSQSTSSNVTNAFEFEGPLEFRVAPAPPGLVLAGLGAVGLAGYGRRRSGA
jgi:hypothetical protein